MQQLRQALATDTRPSQRSPRSTKVRRLETRREMQRERERERERRRNTKQQGRLDTLIFLVRRKRTGRRREGVEMLVE